MLHPLSELFEYVVEQGYCEEFHIKLIVLNYVFFFVDHVAVVFLHFKFFIFAFERWYAINKKGKAPEDGVFAIKLLGGLAMFISLEVLFKTILFWMFDTADSVHVRLKKGLTVTGSAEFEGVCYFIFGFSLVVGVLLYKYTNGYIRKLRLKSESLAESFELSQSNRIANVLKPMIILYLAFGIACGPTLVLCFFMTFCENTSYLKNLYLAGVRVNYFNLSIYTLLSLVVALYKFGLITKRVIPSMPMMKMRDEQDNHFDYLTSSWEARRAKF
ncbi:unnamed protein product [Bursaphelenchus okinawaensis]|uniref:G_PROTEIN_RECEP_F1_2 domain-containing protein n=1 Tax=Bursaphelenchus okinawaensis TaxID=465554 RepID=A0A811KSE9_9BILA|nr:unnamed protein product [Bursaphelenchus okinawaensis]CAG9111197.1 unnamed protein product [Bursaphelenchus okinawaensis]